MTMSDSSVVSACELVIDEAVQKIHSENLPLHLESGDYFALLSTVLGFVEETVANCKCGLSEDIVPLETTSIRDLRRDLNYLQKNYQIVPKQS